MSIFKRPLKAALSAVVCVPALYISGETFAASVSTPVNATATVTFSAPATFTHTLTAVEGLVAGVSASAEIARGHLAFTDTSTDKVAMTFGQTSATSGPISITGLSLGVNNPENKLTYSLGTANGSTDGWSSHEADSLIPYAYVTTTVNGNSLEYSVKPLVSQRSVAADSYIISVDAYSYIS